ncbi:hypothetical protein JCM8097_004803 [Rhodosporidiobolus ruineniae]
MEHDWQHMKHYDALATHQHPSAITFASSDSLSAADSLLSSDPALSLGSTAVGHAQDNSNGDAHPPYPPASSSHLSGSPLPNPAPPPPALSALDALPAAFQHDWDTLLAHTSTHDRPPSSSRLSVASAHSSSSSRPRSPSAASSTAEDAGFSWDRFVHTQQPAPAFPDPTTASDTLPPGPSTVQTTAMPPESSVRDEQPSASTSAGVLRRTGSDPERDLTITIPRRRAASPFGAGERPFTFKRSSSGFSAYLNYAASPTSDLRTRPSTPAVESATRSTFGEGALSESPPSASIPLFAGAAPSLAPLEIPTAPALQLTGATPDTAMQDRPKGKGTLELERVLGMWAAKTPTGSSFPNLPPLPFSSAAAPTSTQPLFTQTILASEPESFVPAAISQPDPVASTSAATFLDLASGTPSGSLNLLNLPRETPRRQRSKSEADIMRLDSLGPTQPPLSSALDFSQRFFPTFPSQVPQPSFDPAQSLHQPTNGFDSVRPPSAPSAYTTATPAFAMLNLDSEQHELNTRSRSSVSRPHPSAGGPGYHEAALLDVPGHQRRARSQGLGHRRSAKSDDFTHLFGSASYTQQAESWATTSTVNGHLAPPGAASAVPSPPHPAPAYSGSPSPIPPSAAGQELVQGYLPNGQPILVPAALVSVSPIVGIADPSSAAAAHFLASSASGSPYSHPQNGFPPPPPPPQQPQPPAHQHPLLTAGQQSALQYLPYPPPSSSIPHSSHLQHRTSFSSHSPRSHPYSRDASPGGQSLPLHPSSPALHPYGSLPSAAGASPHFPSSLGGGRAGGVAPPYPFNHPSPRLSGTGLGLGLPSPPPGFDQGGGSRTSLSPIPIPGALGLGMGGRRSSRAASLSRSARSSDAGLSMLLRGSEEALSQSGRSSAFEGGESALEEDEDDEEGFEDGDGAYEDETDASPPAGMDLGGGGGGEGLSPPKVPSAVGKAKGKSKKASPAAAGGADGNTKESKTTQATIDAAKRRRNANAVAKFVCELCGETFTRRYNLRGHQRAHNGEKPYKCSHDGCDKAFARAHDCKRHELLHLGVRKYHCSPCKRDFVRLDALHRHHRSEVGQACVKQLQAEGAVFDEKGAIAL